MERSARFQLPTPVKCPDAELYQLRLEPVDAQLDEVDSASGGIRFRRRGWYEVLLTVAWDVTNDVGTRFAHTSIPDQQPLHSEAVEARVLNRLSRGEQLLRSNTVFRPPTVDEIRLEIWQDSGQSVLVRAAALVVRELDASE